jgi:hypothetical protein
MRHTFGLIALGFFVIACDYKYDGTSTYTPAGPPGSTAALGSVTVVVDGEPLTASLPTPATWRNDNFSFAALNAAGKSKTFALSVRLPGPGTYAVGAPGSPAISYIESDDATIYRWFANSQRGAGSVTVSFLTSESAGGNFSVELLPDSATAAAGFTDRRFLTGGTFSVSVSR